MFVCLVHGYILFLKLRHMCDGLVKFDPGPCRSGRRARIYNYTNIDIII